MLEVRKKINKLGQHIKGHVSIADEELELILSRFEEKEYRKRKHLLGY